ncbi:MAG: hypothetical protein Ct9H300mP14_10390 [Gammaproteobacteria bacterium]|nr:MAG: hypothetical protein Ct9H300mP14_10390 [Gammaproteobacteria bacterium]
MATVLAKMETLNPTGSVKDRMAINMVKRAEKEGLLKPGGTLVERPRAILAWALRWQPRRKAIAAFLRYRIK